MDRRVLPDRYPVLNDLPAAMRERVLTETRPLRVPEGQTIFGVGSPCRALPLITSGSARVVTFAQDGREILLYKVLPGESCLLSVCCLLGRSDYSAFGIVEADLEAALIGESLFRTLVNESEPFRTFLFAVFADRVTHLMGLVEQVAFQRLDQRLASLLYERGPAIEATHQNLADELGSVREVVSRLLKHFEQQGLLRLGRRRIEVLTPPGLERIAAGR